MVWQFLTKISIVGNAALFVLLGGGSHDYASAPIYPHKPVHLERQLSGTMNMQPYLGELHAGQQLWDDVTYGGSNIILNTNSSAPYEDDAYIIDGNHGQDINVSFEGHNGQEATWPEVNIGSYFECSDQHDLTQCWWGYTKSIPASLSGINQNVKLVVVNRHLFTYHLTSGNRYRTFAHEFGHILNLGDHDDLGEPGDYDFMMDSIPDTYPADYLIADLGIAGFADEASCVRDLFNLPGYKACD